MLPSRSSCVSAAVVAGLALALAHCSDVSGSVPGADAGACSANTLGGGDDGGDDAGACSPGDSDGLNGGCQAFDLTVDDTGFTPIILKAQNLATVTLKLTNAGTRPHDFVLSCLATPNGQGCPQQSCFPAAADVAALAPGQSATTTFVTPNPEGIYVFRSDVGDDSQLEADGGVAGLWGQFVVQ